MIPLLIATKLANDANNFDGNFDDVSLSESEEKCVSIINEAIKQSEQNKKQDNFGFGFGASEKKDAKDSDGDENDNDDGSERFYVMVGEIDSFRPEIDLYNSIFDFFVGNEGSIDKDDLANTILIHCESVNDPTRLVHYLHARYLITVFLFSIF